MPLSRRRSAAIFGTSLAAALLAVTAQCVNAQTRTTKTDSPAATAPASSVAPVSSEPNTTTASFGDWTLRCQRVGEADKATRVCEVAQAMQVQGQTAPVAQIAIGKLSPGEPLRVTAVLPTSISFPSSVQITTDKDAAPLELTWRRCLSGGCFADGAPKDETIARWRSATQPGHMTFKDAADRDIAIPLSFRGLAPALDALTKEKG